MSFGGDIKLSVLGNPLKLAQVLLGVSSLASSFPVNQYKIIIIIIKILIVGAHFVNCVMYEALL